MFSIFGKIFEKLNLRLNIFNRSNSPSLKFKQTNKGDGDNVAGDKYVYNNQNPSNNSFAEVVWAWSIPETHQENHKIIEYEFGPTLLNKSDQIVKDLYINFSSSGFNLNVEGTPQLNVFEGWNVHGEALNLITKPEYRYAPNNLLYPFKIRILFKKGLIPPHDAWLYFSFGAPNVKKFEKEVRVSELQIKEFIEGKDHDTRAFLRFLGLSNDGSNVG
ncbi:hypothetical protein COU18_02120 [Candidatus Kaiserbacteria bacterium CG10_big_fil_rev_8_21_14_0_10_51_14]|uniref:Uncharacterized protein n=1 Tax=Candidatus Kaiserbacteria bacterium CG10_big_fil_rev_8_21_14_0_10_51_14 TaxID=1974610 RepID=A0A2H0UBQ8_9BACT|nr:MAG: hypothetical protein COU18_02120 [Candidatus Kaiserbacteria bacterium CG10_big_fil_rev_8_21_14_0_10_51_14]